MNKNAEAVRLSLGQFFKTTTLHGFKYLWSEFYIDRLGWLISCCASTCCAGVLCAVLWARFLQVPALLQLQDVNANSTFAQHMPQLAVCPPLHHQLSNILRNMSMNSSTTNRLLRTIENVLTGKPASEKQFQILDQLVSDLNMTLPEMLLKHSPTCEDLVLTCRWQRAIVPCESLFEKRLTSGGVCCVMRPEKAYYRLNESLRPSPLFGQMRALDLVLHCSNESVHGCKFFAKYDVEPNMLSIVLTPGYIYFGTILFVSVPMNSVDEVLESNCISDLSYSTEMCQNKCAEKHCGCSDPLCDSEVVNDNNMHHCLPLCTIPQIACLRNYGHQDNVNCSCLPPCDKISSTINLESTCINLNAFTLDPIYNGITTKSTVLHIRLNIPLSKIFTLNPTETWLTLLSSLGGVFNMFLGVGLFSALEIIYLLFFKLPSALFKSPYN